MQGGTFIYYIAASCYILDLTHSDSCDDINYLVVENSAVSGYNDNSTDGVATFEDCQQLCSDKPGCLSCDYEYAVLRRRCSYPGQDRWTTGGLSYQGNWHYAERCDGCSIAPEIPFSTRTCYQNDTQGFLGNYTCDLGYEFPTGSRTAVFYCSCETETWEPADMCSLANCGEPPIPEGAEMTGSVFTYLSEVIFRCAAGFIHRGGDTIRTCQADRTWSTSPIVCESKHRGLFQKTEMTNVAGLVLGEIPSRSLIQCSLYCVREVRENKTCQSFAFSNQNGTCILQTEVDATPWATLLKPDWTIYSLI